MGALALTCSHTLTLSPLHSCTQGSATVSLGFSSQILGGAASTLVASFSFCFHSDQALPASIINHRR